MTEGRSYNQWLEDDGYEAGLAGKELTECPRWDEAWAPPGGTNKPAYIIAGWIAGRARWRFKQEEEKADPQ